MDVQAVVLGERIFVPGGTAASGKSVSVLEAYSPRLNRWDALTPMPAAVSGYALAAFEGRIYLFGGWDGALYSAAVYSYDPADDTWQSHSALPQARAFAAAAVVESKIYVIGGYDGQVALRDQLVYLPDRDRNNDQPWEQRAPLPEGRYGMNCTVLANLIYLVGGLDDANQAGGLTPLVYQPLNDRWTSFDLPPESLGNHPALLGLETRLHVLGGETPTGLLASHLTYQAIYTIAIPSIQQ
jgi:N-acetylneuraminic acid mutarotase